MVQDLFIYWALWSFGLDDLLIKNDWLNNGATFISNDLVLFFLFKNQCRRSVLAEQDTDANVIKMWRQCSMLSYCWNDIHPSRWRCVEIDNLCIHRGLMSLLFSGNFVLKLFSQTGLCNVWKIHKWLVMGFKKDKCVIRACLCHCASMCWEGDSFIERDSVLFVFLVFFIIVILSTG